jgi:hypothetical protein
MITKLDPQILTNLSDGLITSSAVSSSQIPLSTVSESLNIDFDKIGSAKTRLGTTLLGSQISSGTDILGLYEFRDSGEGTDNQLMVVNGTTLYYLNGASWTSKRTGLTAGAKADFTTFLDYTFMVNGYDTTMTWAGDASDFGTTNASGAPIGNYVENFRSRVWIATSLDKVYHSSLPSTDATPTIEWSSDDYLTISPQDGDNITGLKRYKNALLVFKRDHIYRIYSINETEPDPKISVGTYSRRSIVEAVDGIYFHHPSGIYRYNENGISCLSEPIIDFINNITVANYSKIAGWQDGNHVYFSVGDVTIGDISYINVVLRYTISSRVWSYRSYPTQFIAVSKYNDGTTIYNLCGDDDGNVLKMDTGNTDNGSAIFYSLTSRPYTLDGLFSTRKHISKMAVVHKNAVGASVKYRVDSDNVNDFRHLININSEVAKPFTADIKGNVIYFNISGSSVGEPIEIIGWEILEATSETIT